MERETRQGILLGVRLALAHHPLCTYFEADVFGRRVRVCQGCVLTWPLFLVALPLAWRAPLWGASWDVLLALGVLGGVPQAVTTLWRGPRAFRVAAKVVGGPALAALLAGLAWAPIALSWKFAAAGVLLCGLLALLGLRMRSILRTCDGCMWRRRWGQCPGFGQTDIRPRDVRA